MVLLGVPYNFSGRHRLLSLFERHGLTDCAQPEKRQVACPLVCFNELIRLAVSRRLIVFPIKHRLDSAEQ
jgi:hypothetical protein